MSTASFTCMQRVGFFEVSRLDHCRNVVEPSAVERPIGQLIGLLGVQA
jgi:hypothetical protein